MIFLDFYFLSSGLSFFFFGLSSFSGAFNAGTISFGALKGNFRIFAGGGGVGFYTLDHLIFVS